MNSFGRNVGNQGRGVGNVPAMSPPEQNPEFTQGGAPGGLWPVVAAPVAVPGGNPGNLGGYSADPGRDELPLDNMVGFNKAPSGNRR